MGSSNSKRLDGDFQAKPLIRKYEVARLLDRLF